MLNGKEETFEQTTDFKKKGESDASNSAYEEKERKRGHERANGQKAAEARRAKGGAGRGGREECDQNWIG